MISKFIYLRILTTPINTYKNELNMKIRQSIYNDFSYSLNNSISFKLYLISISKKSSYKTEVRRACVLSGRVRSIDNDFSFSRFTIKQRALGKNLTGIKKSSW